MNSKLDSLTLVRIAIWTFSVVILLAIMPGFVIFNSSSFWLISGQVLVTGLLVFCMFVGVYVYVLLPVRKWRDERRNRLNLKKCEKLKNRLREKLNTLSLKPENNSGLARYQLDLFQSEFKKIESINRLVSILKSVKNLSSLEKSINYFCKKRKRCLTLVKKQVVAESMDLLSRIEHLATYITNNAYLNCLDECSDSIQKIFLLAKELKRISESYSEISEDKDIVESMTALREIALRMKELADNVVIICKAEFITNAVISIDSEKLKHRLHVSIP